MKKKEKKWFSRFKLFRNQIIKACVRRYIPQVPLSRKRGSRISAARTYIYVFAEKGVGRCAPPKTPVLMPCGTHYEPRSCTVVPRRTTENHGTPVPNSRHHLLQPLSPAPRSAPSTHLFGGIRTRRVYVMLLLFARGCALSHRGIMTTTTAPSDEIPARRAYHYCCSPSKRVVRCIDVTCTAER